MGNRGFSGKIEISRGGWLKMEGSSRNGGSVGFWSRNRGKVGKSREFDDFWKIGKNREK